MFRKLALTLFLQSITYECGILSVSTLFVKAKAIFREKIQVLSLESITCIKPIGIYNGPDQVKSIKPE